MIPPPPLYTHFQAHHDSLHSPSGDEEFCTGNFAGYYPDSSHTRAIEVVHRHCAEAAKPLTFLKDDRWPPVRSIDMENDLVGAGYNSKIQLNHAFKQERGKIPPKSSLYCSLICLCPLPPHFCPDKIWRVRASTDAAVYTKGDSEPEWVTEVMASRLATHAEDPVYLHLKVLLDGKYPFQITSSTLFTFHRVLTKFANPVRSFLLTTFHNS